MTFKFSAIKQNPNGFFGPTSKGQFYKPISYHNKSAILKSSKTRWNINKGSQYQTFKLSNEAEWFCNNKNGLFSILDNGNVILGKGDERLSFFPAPSNSGDPWHGYPVKSSEYEIGSELLKTWITDGIITERIRIKILKGQI